MRLHPIPLPSVQQVTCSCGSVLHVRDSMAECKTCQTRILVRIEVTKAAPPAGGQGTGAPK